MRCSYSFNPVTIAGTSASNYVRYNVGIKLTKQWLEPINDLDCCTTGCATTPLGACSGCSGSCSSVCVSTVAGKCTGACSTGCTSGGPFGSGTSSVCGKPIVGKCSPDFFVVFNGMLDTYPTATFFVPVMNLGTAPTTAPLTLGLITNQTKLGPYYSTNANGQLGLLFQSGSYGGFSGKKTIYFHLPLASHPRCAAPRVPFSL